MDSMNRRPRRKRSLPAGGSSRKTRTPYARGEVVEPIKPITYYIDPATPTKWRRYVKEGVESVAEGVRESRIQERDSRKGSSDRKP